MKNFKQFLIDESVSRSEKDYKCKLNLSQYTPNKIITNAQVDALQKNCWTYHTGTMAFIDKKTGEKYWSLCYRFVMEAGKRFDPLHGIDEIKKCVAVVQIKEKAKKGSIYGDNYVPTGKYRVLTPKEIKDTEWESRSQCYWDD